VRDLSGFVDVDLGASRASTCIRMGRQLIWLDT
jgi:hypothetical protein